MTMKDERFARTINLLYTRRKLIDSVIRDNTIDLPTDKIHALWRRSEYIKGKLKGIQIGIKYASEV